MLLIIARIKLEKIKLNGMKLKKIRRIKKISERNI